MVQCEFCKHKEKDGHEEPCIRCKECGVPYIEGAEYPLEDKFETAKKISKKAKKHLTR